MEYRFGLCHEALGKTDRAIAAYRKAISTSNAPPLTMACELGAARCLLQRNEPAQARLLLDPFFSTKLASRSCPRRSSATRASWRPLPGPAKLMTPRTDRLVDDNAISFAAVPLQISFYLDIVGTNAKSKDAADGDKKNTPLSVRRPH